MCFTSWTFAMSRVRRTLGFVWERSADEMSARRAVHNNINEEIMKSSVALLTAACTLAAGVAVAAYPEKTINYIVAFGPGGESDVSARLQESYFKEYTGQSVAMGYKTDDLENVYWFHYTPDSIVVPADSPYKTLKDLVADAKRKPGALTFSGSDTNSANHLAQQRFDTTAGIRTTYGPFKGTGASNTALLGKQVAAAWSYTTVNLQLGNQVRCLGVAMEKRHPALPDCPTMKEQGYNLASGAYRGVAVPKSTPQALQKQISDLVGKNNHDPKFVKQMEDKGFAMTDVSLDKMDAFMAERKKDYGAIAKEMGITRK